MRRISIHISVSIWSSTVAEKNWDLMGTFRNLGKEIPKHIWIFAVGLGIPFLSVNKIRELSWITNEKHWCIVSCHIPITFFSIKLYSKSTWISFCICWSFFTAYSRETRKNRGFFTYLFKRFCLSKLSNIMSTFKYPWAPLPFACTTLSGIRSLSKWASLSIKWKS